VKSKVALETVLQVFMAACMAVLAPLGPELGLMRNGALCADHLISAPKLVVLTRKAGAVSGASAPRNTRKHRHVRAFIAHLLYSAKRQAVHEFVL
jgi:hypothetical protein